MDAERPPHIADTPAYSPYGTELAGAYLATAALGVALPVMYGEIDPQPGAGGFLLAFTLACTPVPIVHWLNDRPGRAIATFFLVPGLFLATTFIGTLISLLIIDATMTADTPEEQEDGALARGFEALAVGVTAGVIAVGTWAVFDVLDAEKRPRRSSAQLRFGITPRPDGAAAVLAGRF